MAQTSKDLLQLERKNPPYSSIESALLVCKNDSISQTKKPHHGEKPTSTTPVPSSQVLGKVKDFLGVISEANKRLQLDAKDKSSKEYDIEALTGNESEYIEMDLMLGIADLHTPEAVAAAESAIAGYQPIIPLAATCSESELEDSSDDDDDSDDDEDEDEDEYNSDKRCSPVKPKRSKSREDISSSELGNPQLTKRSKIVVLS
ncbi:hypothetical protein L1049_014484 [Liquidambar formosana]|uniref:Uncharacterized protein n=1 Tax=Liquidambar formosana TaxID=63359 RepID=A0AAP0WZ17_LIQFO